MGAATLVKPSTTRETEYVVFGSDFHFPYQDDGAIESFLSLVAWMNPDRVVLNGDIADFFQLSRFNISGSRVENLQEEIDQANDFRRQVREAAPNAVIDETEGNHDSRVITYVQKNAQALQSLRALTPRELFKYGEYEINSHPGCGFLLRAGFLTKHGTLVRGEAGATAKAELALAGVSGISGHTHRLARYRKVGYAQREWLEQGCFCRLNPDYVTGAPNWTQGCAIGEFSTKTASFVLHEIPYIDGKLRFGRESF
jgi:predicted phosphodiesterase